MTPLAAASLIPSFDFHEHIVKPWQEYPGMSAWIVLLGFLVSLVCGLIGNFLLLRRMALAGDAISHSVLPGLVIAYAIFGNLGRGPMMLGAAAAGLLTMMLIEFLIRRSRVKSDAATGVVFTAMFALGVLLIRLFANRVHLDVECVLYGQMEFASLPVGDEPRLPWIGHVPFPVLTLASLAVLEIFLLHLFFKELVLTSFDSAHAATQGVPVNAFHFGLMAFLSFIVVATMEIVGAILVVGMLILPPATARFFSNRLVTLLWLSALFALLGSITGLHLATWWRAPLAAAMVVSAGAWFLLAWVFAPGSGLLGKLLRLYNGREVDPSSTLAK